MTTPAEIPRIPKELSWLSFNERVLQEAEDPDVPLIQRLRYLGIFSNNMDEFFRVRVADVQRLANFSPPSRKEEYHRLLEQIRDGVMTLQHRFNAAYDTILADMRKRKIYLVNEQQLDEYQQTWVRNFFYEHIQPEISPIMLDDQTAPPELNDSAIYLAVKLHTDANVRYALVEIPSTRVGRFIRIPKRRGKGQRGKVVIALDNIIRLCLEDVFLGILPLKSAEAYTIKITRDAELELGEEITESFFERISQSLKKRRSGDPVRFVYDSKLPEDLLNYFTRRLMLGKLDSIIPGGRYHNSKDFMGFPNLGPSYLEFKPLPPIKLPWVDKHNNIFDALRERDILLYYPYHSFSYLERLAKTAAIDPTVRSIKICLYRVASVSHIADALLNAVQNQKEVTVVVELQARFDEEANIDLAERLTDNGINVIFGVPGLKVHSKLLLITRMENGVQRYYSHVGTGNFNEKTAKLYTDFSLITYNQEMGEELWQLFDFITFTYRRHSFKHLMVSPLDSREKLLSKIRREAANARDGKPSAITLKCNNLVDNELIDALYAASGAGVCIRIIVRGMCSLVPQVAGLSDNIEAISIVDRYLEHPRVYVFHNDGEPEYYIGSADLMTRNIDYRVEAIAPVHDPQYQQQIQDILNIQWCDNIKARIIDGKMKNKRRERGRNAPIIRSQEAIHTYLSTGKLPKIPKKRLAMASLKPKPAKKMKPSKTKGS